MSEESGPFVTQIDPSLGTKLRRDLIEQGFELSTPPYTHFAAKKKGISLTFYLSGKLVVQGKGKNEFIEFYLEPEVLKSFSFGYKKAIQDTLDTSDINLSPHIGIDESGKGDFFGPLCVAGVYGDEKTIKELKKIGVKDSKVLTDQAAGTLSAKIRGVCPYHIVRINPFKYNELYAKFGNLNTFLAWGHATTIEEMVRKTSCESVIIDQFAAQHVVETALKRKKLEVKLTQRHRAEEDLVVAAASILARHAFLEGLRNLSEEFGIILPKGASPQVIAVGKQLVMKYGPEVLTKVAKTHFKTYGQVV
ncbi:MAG: ribonuclease HIII [Chlamydiales bacterium]|nr:ribonuclease HIII [Chlamydiales bacterium]